MPTKFPGLFNDGIALKREPVIKFLSLFIDEKMSHGKSY